MSCRGNFLFHLLDIIMSHLATISFFESYMSRAPAPEFSVFFPNSFSYTFFVGCSFYVHVHVSKESITLGVGLTLMLHG